MAHGVQKELQGTHAEHKNRPSSQNIKTGRVNMKPEVVQTPARGVVVSASASVLVGRVVDSRPGLTKTL